MNSLMKTCLAALASLAALPFAFAAPSEPELSVGEALQQIEALKGRAIERDVLNDQYPPAFWKDRNDPKKTVLRAVQLFGVSALFESMAKAPNIEESSKTPKQWFEKVAAQVKRMAVLRAKLEDCLENGDRGGYFRNLSAYVELRDGLAKMIAERPVFSPEEYKKVKEDYEKFRVKESKDAKEARK